MTTRRRLVGKVTANFSNPGDRYTGTYLSVEEVPYAGGKMLQKYTFISADDETYIVMGNTKIDEGMAEAYLDDVVEITYLGESPTSGGFAIRLFEVAIIEEIPDDEG